jgi:hypothetical protein
VFGDKRRRAGLQPATAAGEAGLGPGVKAIALRRFSDHETLLAAGPGPAGQMDSSPCPHIPSVPPGRRSHQPGFPRHSSICNALRVRPGSVVNLARLESVPHARRLLLGASVYRLPVDEIGLAWQARKERHKEPQT